MRLNNKGFAISGVIYALMFVFIAFMFGILGILGTRKLTLDKYKFEVANNLENNNIGLSYSKVDKSGAPAPILSKGMIPVRYEDNNLVKADFKSEYDQNWYSYEKKDWANAVIVKSETLLNYENMEPGTLINDNDILGYYVWIPRYKYRLFNTNFNFSEVSNIEIIFENIDTPKSTGVLNDTYLTHPAFTFGDQEISGFWFAKFETTGTLSNPTSLPNSKSITNASVKSMFDSVKNVESNYIQNGDMHMTKNIEWSAVSYLATSGYGIEDIEVGKNGYNNSGVKTGCANGTSVNSTICINQFRNSDTYPQSTTGNITGVFDMSGGNWEYVMAVLYNNEPLYLLSGFDESNIPNKKYYDTYTYELNLDGSIKYKQGLIGSSTFEVLGWYQDRNTMVNEEYPWQFRGGCKNDDVDAGIFAYSAEKGGANGSISYRISIVSE